MYPTPMGEKMFIFPNSLRQNINDDKVNYKVQGKDEDIEDTLLEIGNVGIKISQGIGYIPLTMATNYKTGKQTFQFKLMSLSFMCAMAWISTQLTVGVMWNILRDSLHYVLHANLGAIDKVAFTVSGALITGSTIRQRIYGIFYIKHMMKFWIQLTTVFGNISGSDLQGRAFLIRTKDAKHSQIFQKIKIKIAKLALFELALVGIFLALFLISYVRDLAKFDGLEGSSKIFNRHFIYIMCIVLWNIIGALNVFTSIWITFPLLLLNGVLEMIGEELEELSTVAQLPLFIVKQGQSQGHQGQGQTQSTKTLLMGLDDHKLKLCMENYFRVSKIVKTYEGHFGWRIIGEIAYNFILILGYCFMWFIWWKVGLMEEANSRIIPIILCLLTICHLGSDAGQLVVSHGRIFQNVCRIPLHLLEEELQLKVKSWISEMNKDDLSIRPGLFFTLNRQLITSLLSSILTFLVVLVQFRDGEFQQASSN